MADLLAQIEAGQLAPVYFLCGESFPLERAARAIRTAVVGGDGASLNLDALQAGEHDVDSVLAAARTVPMFGARRLVQVREVHRWSAKELARLVPYVRDPAPHSCLLLLAEKADMRTKAMAEIKRHGVVERFEPLKERAAPRWLAQEARRRSIELRPGAAERIVDAVGADMGQLASALERLSLYAGVGRPVEPEHVDDLLARTRQRSIFELTNAVGRGQRREALDVLRKMLQDREPGLRIVAMLARHLRQLWSVRELDDRRTAPKAIAKQAGIHPYFVQDMIHQARGVGAERFARMHRALFEADRSLKSSRLSDAAVLELLVMSLCSGANAEGRATAR